jgi:hypothetical protein
MNVRSSTGLNAVELALEQQRRSLCGNKPEEEV